MGAACGGEPEDPTLIQDEVLVFVDNKPPQGKLGQKTHPLVCVDRKIGLNFLPVGAFIAVAQKH